MKKRLKKIGIEAFLILGLAAVSRCAAVMSQYTQEDAESRVHSGLGSWCIDTWGNGVQWDRPAYARLQ